MFDVIQSPVFRQYAVVIAANLCVISLGLGLAWPSPVLVKLRNETDILPRPITDDEGSWIVSGGFLAAFVAMLLPAILVDILGRRLCIFAGCMPKILAALLFIFANNVSIIIAGRVLNTISDCFILSLVPMYTSEIASKDIRGTLGTVLQIMSSLGIVTMFSLGPFISYLALNIMFLTTTVIVTIPLIFLPETPYFLYSKGKTAEALRVLTFLRGSETIATEEIQEYATSKTNTKEESKISLLKNRTVLKALGIVIVLGIGGQLVGFNAVSFYLQTILESTKTNIRDEIGSVIIGCIQLLASFVTAAISDRFGRKPIYAVTLIGQGIGMLGLGLFFWIQQSRGEVSGFMNFLPIISLILVVFTFSAGYGSITFPLIAELFEGPARGIGMSAAIISSTIFVFLTTRYFPAITTSIGPAVTYWTFAVMCLLFCLFILFCIPETKGRTFAEIQKALGANVGKNGKEGDKRDKGGKGDVEQRNVC